eukprot:9178765-Pyramimonas_sp.AAC.3
MIRQIYTSVPAGYPPLRRRSTENPSIELYSFRPAGCTHLPFIYTLSPDRRGRSSYAPDYCVCQNWTNELAVLTELELFSNAEALFSERLGILLGQHVYSISSLSDIVCSRLQAQWLAGTLRRTM